MADTNSPDLGRDHTRGKDQTIFVQIASYRDPELLTTLRDCKAKASHPHRLHFGLAWQHDQTETLAEFAEDPHVRVFDCHWTESRGACWARHQLQRFYDGETYTLSLDSHHRFVKGWDDALITQLTSLASQKPVLTNYLPEYEPGEPMEPDPPPSTMGADHFEPEGALLFRGYFLKDSSNIVAPFRARFLSAHFIFAPGNFVIDCGHDPELYFHGEEISLAVRAFTHGYDLFHPDRTFIYHRYERAGRPKHWDDHAPETGWPHAFHFLDAHSKKRLRVLLGMEDGKSDFGRFGLGPVRTLAAYEQYAGVNFADRVISRSAWRGEPAHD